MFNARDRLKGVPSSRLFRHRKLLELTVDRLLGKRVRADGADAIDLWSALANVEWFALDGGIVRYSQRAAGEMVA